MSCKYKFSVIMAVYNVEDYIRESIDSLINQTIDFEDIQVILVDDGSPDGSGAICDEYAEKYSNVVVAHKENGGVSSARNRGLELVEGEFVNFLDPDDLLTPKTLKKVYQFFKKHYDEVDIVSIPLVFFEGMKGNHGLNYKYNKGTRVVDLTVDYFNPQLSLSSAFVKSELFKGVRFDTRLAYAEDAQLIQRFLIHKQKLGLVADEKYMYRRRVDGLTSAIQASYSRPAWYLPYMKYFQVETINFYKEKLGYVPKFIQATLMSDLQWRLKRNIPDDILNDEEKLEYMELFKEVLRHIDSDVIVAQRNITPEVKLFAHVLKYGRYPEITVDEEGYDALMYGEEKVFRLRDCAACLQFIDIKDDSLTIEGYANMFDIPLDSFKVKIEVNGELFDCEINDVDEVKALNTVILNRHYFRGTAPLSKENNTVNIVTCVNGKNMTLTHLSFGKFAPLTVRYKKSYYCDKERVLYSKANTLFVKPCTAVGRFFKEISFLSEMWRKKRNGGRNAVKARIAMKLLPFKWKKPIWVISDRASKAGDNGEAFFRFMRENHPEIDAYFIINEKCDDYKRMSKLGNVVPKDSFKHKLLLLMSEYIISSHAEDNIFNPFYTYHHGYRDILVRKKFVFLQHGITQNDLSGWLKRRNKNIYGFITAAKPEYNSILECAYDYDESSVWLTGFARFDRLYRDEKKQITLMPTWRKYIMGELDKFTGMWTVGEDFEESDFVKFYRGVLSSKRLTEAMEKYGYNLAFMPHPNLQPHLNYFKVNDKVEFLNSDIEYRDIYARSNLILTDYSSAVFDFAYLRKPVLYCHFDYDEFFGGNHTLEKGYFDYERDGFGEVEKDVESTVSRIIEYMENDCKMKDKYLERLDNFFAFNDKENCKRIFDKIIESENKS